MNGLHTLSEILDQAVSWRAAGTAVLAQPRLADLLADDSRPVLFTGCGSPALLCQTAAAVHRSYAGRQAYAVAASELLLHPRAALPAMPPPLVVAVSRSGSTDELVAACRMLQGQGSTVLAVTAAPDSPLAELADERLVLADADEVSLAQTRSFSAMLVATLGLVGAAHGDPPTAEGLDALVAAAPALLSQTRALIEAEVPATVSKVFFLGSGPLFGLAGEGALKTNEMSLTPAAAHPVLEFRHGPQALVDPDALVVGLLSPQTAELEVPVLSEARRHGGTVLTLGADAGELPALPWVPASGPIGLVRYLPALQLLGYVLSARRGLDPDLPRNLERFVRLPALHTAAKETP